MIFNIILWIILGIQSVSDIRTKSLYYVLNLLGMFLLFFPVIPFIKEEYLFFLTAVAFVWIQSMCGVYAYGDAKLLIMVVERLTVYKSGVDIWIELLMVELFAILIFSIYVLTYKVINHIPIKIKDNYPYAPAITISYMIVAGAQYVGN